MSFRPFANVGWAMLVLVNHEAFTMFSLPLIILGEGILLWCVLPRHSFWRSLGRSLGYSLSMNVVSALLGLVPGPLLLGLVEPSSRTFLDPSYYDSSSSGIETLWLKLTFVAWALSVVSEGLILMLLSKPRRRTEKVWSVGRMWLASLVANVVSYVAVFVVYPYVFAGGIPKYV